MIIVFGSINMDMLYGVDRLPRPGETLLAKHFEITPGGKGANQALAALRAGARAVLVGRTGEDAYSKRMLSDLRQSGVITSGVTFSDKPTGTATIILDDHGENQIVVAPGANMDSVAEQVPEEILNDKAMVLLQMEVDPEQNLELAEKAKKCGARVMLNLAPVTTIPRRMVELVDDLIVNHVEAEEIAGIMKIRVGDDAIRIAQALALEGGLNCIVTLGGNGAVAVTKEGHGWRVPGYPLDEVIDTAGAGDCYCGTLAAGLNDGMPLHEAMQRAGVAASLACLKKGCQTSYVYMGDVEKALENAPAPETVSL